jgi:hypothetical protein
MIKNRKAVKDLENLDILLRKGICIVYYTNDSGGNFMSPGFERENTRNGDSPEILIKGKTMNGIWKK